MQARPEKARQLRPEGAQPRARRRHRHDGGAHLLRLRGDHPRAAERLLVPARAGAAAAAARSRSRRRSRTSTAAVLAGLAGKQVMVGCIDLVRPGGRVGRDGRRAHRARAAVRQGRERDPRARLRHEVPAARARRRQAARDGRGGEDPARAPPRGEGGPDALRLLAARPRRRRRAACAVAPRAQGLPGAGRRPHRLRRPAPRRRRHDDDRQPARDRLRRPRGRGAVARRRAVHARRPLRVADGACVSATCGRSAPASPPTDARPGRSSPRPCATSSSSPRLPRVVFGAGALRRLPDEIDRARPRARARADDAGPARARRARRGAARRSRGRRLRAARRCTCRSLRRAPPATRRAGSAPTAPSPSAAARRPASARRSRSRPGCR